MRVRGGGARDRLRAHGGALLLGPLECRWTTWFTKYGGPTERKWSNRTQVVQADRGRHDMRDAVPPGETTGGSGLRNRPAVAQFVPADADTQSSPDTQPRPGPRARHLTREHVC